MTAATTTTTTMTQKNIDSNTGKTTVIKKRGRGRPKGVKNISHEKYKRPKRPLSAYNLFYKDERSKMNPDDVNFETLATIIGNRWKNVDEERKKVYQYQATELMKIYKEKMKIYNTKVKAYEERKNEQKNAEGYKPELSNAILSNEVTDYDDEDDEEESIVSNAQQLQQQLLHQFAGRNNGMMNFPTLQSKNTAMTRQNILHNIILPLVHQQPSQQSYPQQQIDFHKNFQHNIITKNFNVNNVNNKPNIVSRSVSPTLGPTDNYLRDYNNSMLTLQEIRNNNSFFTPALQTSIQPLQRGRMQQDNKNNVLEDSTGQKVNQQSNITVDEDIITFFQ